jgi:hypothetical protein
MNEQELDVTLSTYTQVYDPTATSTESLRTAALDKTFGSEIQAHDDRTLKLYFSIMIYCAASIIAESICVTTVVVCTNDDA